MLETLLYGGHVFSEMAFLRSLVVAVVLGALLGLERSVVGKQAGMRTYALVSLGSCLFAGIGVLASTYVAPFGLADPLRIASSIVVGIGFIGAGLAAMRAEGGHAELTTAAGIWVAAAVGMAAGFGFYFVAFAATILCIAVFSLFTRFENWARGAWGTERN